MEGMKEIMKFTEMKTEDKGIALATALISGVSVFANGIAVKSSDAIVYTTLKNLGALVFLAAAAFMLKEFRQFAKLIGKVPELIGKLGMLL